MPTIVMGQILEKDIDPEDVRKVYIHFRRQIPGEEQYRPAARWEEIGIWDKIASFLKGKNCQDIWGFLASGFKTEIAVYPNMFLGEKAWQRYQEYLKTCRDFLAEKLVADFQAFLAYYSLVRRYRDAEQAVEITLLNPLVPVTALFRYILATVFNLDSVRERFFKEAQNQLCTAPTVYEELWPIPPELWRRRP